MSTTIRERDVLYEMYEELLAQGRALAPYDADRREQWAAQARELLTLVPDAVQRWAWTYYLAGAVLTHLPGTPLPFVMAWLSIREDDAD